MFQTTNQYCLVYLVGFMGYSFIVYWYIYVYNVEPPVYKIAKLVSITSLTLVYDTYNYGIHGGYKPIYNWGAPHCMYI